MIPVDPKHPLARGQLIAFDPGLNNPAAALFKNGELQAAERIRLPTSLKSLELTERALRIADLTLKWVLEHGGEKGHTLVWEKPQVYRGSAAIGDPKDLISLSVVGGAVACILQPTKTYSPTPQEWTMGTSKAKQADKIWTSSRGVRAEKRFSSEEKGRIQDSHDAADAAALGLYCLGRWEKIRVFSYE